MFNSKETIETIETLESDAKKLLPTYIKIRGVSGDIVYPITAIGSDQNCIVIMAHEEDRINNFDETTKDSAWLERVQK